MISPLFFLSFENIPHQSQPICIQPNQLMGDNIIKQNQVQQMQNQQAKTSPQNVKNPNREAEKVQLELPQRKQGERKMNTNINLQRYLKKRLPPPNKKELNKDVTQKPKYFPWKEEQNKQELQPKHQQPQKQKNNDRSKQISPYPNSNDYHTVSISQRNKMSKFQSVIPNPEGTNRREQRDTIMRKKVASYHGVIQNSQQHQPKEARPEGRGRIQIIKKQASPSQERDCK